MTKKEYNRAAKIVRTHRENFDPMYSTKGDRVAQEIEDAFVELFEGDTTSKNHFDTHRFREACQFKQAGE